MEPVDLSREYFGRGIVLGLRSIGVAEIQLLSELGHYAAREALKYLQQYDEGQFDYRFLIQLDRTHGESGDWSNAVASLYGLLLRGWGEGVYEIMVARDELDGWFRSQPGSRQLWEACARRFLQVFREYQPPR